MANRFHGSGPNMYMYQQQDWVDVLGREAGMGVYGMLIAVRCKRGVVPKGVTISDGRVIT